MKTYIFGAAMALTALAATPALAKSSHAQTAAQAYGAATNEPITADESGLTTRGPAVISFDQYRGWDPDPNIRFQLSRDPNLAD